MGPRPFLAPSLVELRREIDTRWPKRSKASDGWLGDAAHQARTSEHNPDDRGCVHALDVTKDGIDIKVLLRELIGDHRVWYVIHDGVIWSRTHGWAARHYTGANPHTHHAHVSILLTRPAESDTSSWLTDDPAPATRPVLRRGDEGSDVRLVQKAVKVAVDGVFGPRTEAAVKAYQHTHHLAEDGVVGPRTWAPILKDLGLKA